MENICRVTSERDLDEIMTDNVYKLTTVCYIQRTMPIYQQVKSHMLILASQMQDCYFVMVDMNDYVKLKDKYTHELKQLPKISVYYNGSELGVLPEYNKDLFTNMLLVLKSKINEKIRAHKSQENNPPESPEIKTV